MRKVLKNKNSSKKPADRQSAKVVWESYLWLLFVLQMLNWAAIWAGEPHFLDYLDTNIKLPGWIAAWGLFRQQTVFQAQHWRIYLVVLLSWELIYGVLTVVGLTGAPVLPQGYTYQPGVIDLLINVILMLPFYRAIYHVSLFENKADRSFAS